MSTRLSDYSYCLPREFIAQEPLAERDKSRLLVLDRCTGDIEHRSFLDLPEYLVPGDTLVMNDTQVTARRLFGVKPTGGKIEALLMRHLGGGRWEAMVKPGRRVAVGSRICFDGGLDAQVVERTEDGGRVLDFESPEVAEIVGRIGEVPLPPYILSTLSDPSRYQTVYAESPGSAAAPTAGLHFTPKLLHRLRDHGVRTASVTLQVGIATFRPVRVEDIAEHVMHRERVSLSADAAEVINSAEGRVIAVGTTTARVLESAAVGYGKVAAMDGETGLYITPGYRFQILDALITNFHMPKSTLLILVSAFAGRGRVLHAYEEAKRRGYRFLSFGDAMLIV